METKIKWNIGDGNIVATYSGSGNAPIDIASDVANEGIDREQVIQVATADKSTSVDVVVRQTGLRQLVSDSNRYVLCDKNGARFAVLKVGNGLPDVPIVPDEPSVETYTRLTYIEATGVQHLELDYILQETDTIDVLFEPMLLKSADQFVFGSSNTWWSTYNQTGYVRFGNTSSTSISSGTWRYRVQLSQGQVIVDGTTTTTFGYDGLAENSRLNIFAGRSSAGAAYNRGAFRMLYFRIYGADGNAVVNLAPAKRDKDGKVGMLDLVSGKFYVNANTGDDFLCGSEIKVTEGYELIDRIYFNKNKAFNTEFYGNHTTYIDVMFQRTSTSAAAYLFGCIQGDRLTGYLASGSAYWRYGSAYPTFATATLKIYKGVVTPGKTSIDGTSKTFTFSDFQTSAPIPVGGYKSGTNAITKHYIGYIYYFRMRHGDTELLDWYPCKRLSDDVEGFWDCVTQTFVEPI